jgi:hypothetical protein
VNWNEAEHCGTEEAAILSGHQLCPSAVRERRRDDLLASMRVWLLTCAVSLLLMLEDDVAMPRSHILLS